MSINKRELWADYLKGICILLVFVGHLDILPQYIRVFIYLFHMPAFFFCIGFYDKIGISFIEYLRKKSKSLLIPYFFYSFSILTLQQIKNLFFGNGINWQTVRNNIIGTFLCLRNSQYNGSNWFLIASFVACVLYYAIMKNVKNTKTRFIIVVSLSLVITYTSRLFKIASPWYVDVAIICLFYILFGRYIKEKSIIISKTQSFLLIVIGMILSTVIYFFVRNDNVKYLIDYHTARTYPYLLVTIGGIVLLLSFFGLLYNSKHKSLVSYIGENSLIYYLLDWVPYAILNKILNICGLQITNEYLLVIVQIICILLVMPIVVMIIKRYFWFLFGKKKEIWSFNYKNINKRC